MSRLSSSRFMVSYEHSYIFVHVPRTGGSSLEEHLCGFESEPVEPFLQFLPGCGDGRQHLYLEELLQHRDFSARSPQEFFRFCFVRNPWDWYLSEVFYWIQRGHLRGSPSDYRGAFFDLLHAKRIDNHRIESQLDYVSIDGKIAVDFVGRYESIDDDFRRIARRIGIEADSRLPRRNSSLKARPYREYYDEEMKEAVAKRYARDIAAFGYSFPE